MATYHVFTRTWWRRNPNYPGGREPGAGRRYTGTYIRLKPFKGE